MQKSATVALIQNNKLLLLKRGSTAPWNPNKYCLPGGKLEDNEELIECGIRELYEETNIVLDKNSLIPTTISYPKYSKVIFVHVSTLSNLSVELNWEHSDYIWATIMDSKTLPLVPGLVTTIQTLNQNGLLM